jgi:hypothetical protein
MKKVLISALVSTLLVRPGYSTVTTGSLAGRVLQGEGRPVAAAVWVAPATAPEQPLHAAVANDGTFAVDAVPAGTAQLAVETAQGLYVVATPVAIAPGVTRHLQLALGRQDTSPPPGEKKPKRSGGVWSNPLYATLIIVGAAIVVGVGISALTQPNSHPASPSNSNQ